MSVPPESATTPPPPPPAASGMPSAEERQWAMFAHLSALIGVIIPFGSIVAPLIIWQMKKEAMPFVDEQGKEALNFQITVAIAALICFALMLVLIGFLLLWVVGIVALILVVIAAIRANNGEHYRYPFALRLID